MGFLMSAKQSVNGYHFKSLLVWTRFQKSISSGLTRPGFETRPPRLQEGHSTIKSTATESFFLNWLSLSIPLYFGASIQFLWKGNHSSLQRVMLKTSTSFLPWPSSAQKTSISFHYIRGTTRSMWRMRSLRFLRVRSKDYSEGQA